AARAEDRLEALARHVERLEAVGVDRDRLLEVVDRGALVVERQRGHVEAVLARAPLAPEGERLAEVALRGARAEDREDERAEHLRRVGVALAGPVAAPEVAPRAAQDLDR